MVKLTESEARAVWPGSYLKEDEVMVDYSRIDFKKCKLPAWRGESFDVALDDVVEHYDIYIQHNGVVTVIAASKMVRINSEWVIRFSGAFAIEASFVKHVLKCQDIVDSFIASETARIEAKDEAANWVAVPWQDVELLLKNGTLVEFVDSGDGSTLRLEYLKNFGHQGLDYRADRRTFPAGYDPEKPRWVKIHKDDARRLSDAGARVQRKMSWSNDNWRDMTSTERGTPHDYQLDIHTLPPGVPLHEEPKLASRPCSKEFAMKYPNESECRNSGNGFDSGWRNISRFSYDAPAEHYEFRTTAKAEPMARVVVEMPCKFEESNVTLSNTTDFIATGYRLSVEGKNPRVALIVDEVE